MYKRQRVHLRSAEAATAVRVHDAAGRLCLAEKPVGGSGSCLLYTSDAADERSSVDLGGRRIIKKKKERTRRMQDHKMTPLMTKQT